MTPFYQNFDYLIEQVLKPLRPLSVLHMNISDQHGFSRMYLVMEGRKPLSHVSTFSLTDKAVFWFVTQPKTPQIIFRFLNIFSSLI